MRQPKYIGKALAALLAIAAIPMLTLCLGQTQARNENYSQWRGVYTPQDPVLSSHHLMPEGQTVLLTDWQMTSNASRMADVSARTDAGTVEGILQCTSDHPEYITAALERTQVTVDAAGVQIPLTMTPTAAALALTEPQTVHVRVTLQREQEETPALWADYRLNLLPVQPVEETQPQETVEETQPQETQPQETQPQETTEETLPEETVEETQPPLTPAVLQITGTETFAWTEQVALHITAPEQADGLVLQLEGGDFPALTRYRVNGQIYLLGEDMPIEFPVSGAQTCALQLDVSALTQPQSGQLAMQAQTRYRGAVTARGEWTASATRQAMWLDPTQLDPVITGATELSVPICPDTDGLVWRLEMLTETETGIAYMESDEQFYLVVTIFEDPDSSGTQRMITVSNASGKAPAGTYRLTVERIYEDQTLSSTQMQFYICY